MCVCVCVCVCVCTRTRMRVSVLCPWRNYFLGNKRLDTLKSVRWKFCSPSSCSVVGTSPVPYKTTSQQKKKKAGSSLQRFGCVLRQTTTKPVPTWTPGIQHISPGLLPRHLCTSLPPRSFLSGHAKEAKCSGRTAPMQTQGQASPTGLVLITCHADAYLAISLSKVFHEQHTRKYSFGGLLSEVSGCRGQRRFWRKDVGGLVSLRWLSWRNFLSGSWICG